jgi:hypothetical protein
MTGGSCGHTPFNVDDLHDLCRRRLKSLKNKFAIVNMEEEYASLEDEGIKRFYLGLRRLRSAKSAKAELRMDRGRMASVHYWKNSAIGWEYDFFAEGRVCPSLSPGGLLDNFLKSFILFDRGSLSEPDAKLVWAKYLLDGPIGVA